MNASSDSAAGCSETGQLRQLLALHEANRHVYLAGRQGLAGRRGMGLILQIVPTLEPSAAGARLTTLEDVAASGEPANWTFTLNVPADATASITAYTGADPTNPIDGAAATGAATLATAHVAPTVTTSVNADVLITASGVGASTSLTPPAGTCSTRLGPVSRSRTQSTGRSRHACA